MSSWPWLYKSGWCEWRSRWRIDEEIWGRRPKIDFLWGILDQKHKSRWKFEDFGDFDPFFDLFWWGNLRVFRKFLENLMRRKNLLFNHGHGLRSHWSHWFLGGFLVVIIIILIFLFFHLFFFNFNANFTMSFIIMSLCACPTISPILAFTTNPIFSADKSVGIFSDHPSNWDPTFKS